MKRKLALILAISGAAILYSGYYFGLPCLMNSHRFESFLEQKVQQVSGYRIDFVNPKFKMGVLPSVKLTAEEFNVLNDDNSKALYIMHPNLKFKLIPLIFRNIEVSKFNADYLEANFAYDKDNTFKLGQYVIKRNPNQKISLDKVNINLNKYLVALNDETQSKQIKIEGQYLKLSDYHKDKRVKFDTKSKLYTGQKVSILNAEVDIGLPIRKISEDKASLNFDVRNLDLSDFTVYAKALSNGSIRQLSGIINLGTETQVVNGHKNITGSLSIDKLGIMQQDRASSIYSDFPINVTGDVNIIKNGIKINGLKILSDNIDVSTYGNIYKTSAKYPILDLKTTINNLSGERIIPLFPGSATLNPDFNFYKLKEHVIYGYAKGNIDIKGEANYPNLYGDILLSDVYLVEPIKDAPENGTLKLSFKDHKMSLNAHVSTSKTQYADVKGTFTLFRDRYTDMYITSTKEVELAKVKKVLMPLREIFKFELGPIPMMDIPAGVGGANLHIAGSKVEPHAWGEVNFHGGTASFLTINNMVAHNISGNVNFKDEGVKFKTNSAYLFGQKIEIDGDCDLSGNLSVNVSGDNQNSANLINIINTSPVLYELKDMLAPITSSSGRTKVFMNIFGHVDRGVEPVFNKDLFAKGSVEFFNNKMTFFEPKIPASDISGVVNFDREDGDFNIKAKLVNSPIKANGVIKKQTVTANASSDKFNAADGAKIAQMLSKNSIPVLPGLKTINTSFSGHYKGPVNVNDFDYSKITAKGQIYSNHGAKSPIIVNNSSFEIKNSHLTVSQIRGLLENNPFNLQLDVVNILTPKQLVNGTFAMKNFNLATLNNLNIPQVPQLKDFKDFTGKIDIASKIKNNKVRVFTKLGNTSFVYKPKQLKVKFLNGNVLLDDDTLVLGKINSYFGEMPLFIDGKVTDITQTPSLNLYLNAKPTQEFFDQFFNANSVYPIKLKGDLLVVSKLNGAMDKLSSKTEIKIDENSSFYYMGATIGDLVHPVKISVDSNISPNKIKLNSFVYDKIVSSQNSKLFANTQLRSSGEVEFLKDNNLKFKNFKIKTENPTDAKIFNIMFKKPLMKQGLFTSDLLINGSLDNPKLLGKLDITSIDVPVVDATVKDISLDFQKDNIYINTKSSVLENNILLKAVMKNSLAMPYVFKDINLHFDDLDLNKITGAMQDYDTTLYKQNLGVEGSAKAIEPGQVMINKASITADKIKIHELRATDFKSTLSLGKNNIVNINNYEFKLADGTVSGDVLYNLSNNKLDLNIDVHNSNAQTLADSLFNLKGQFYGLINGKMLFSCNGLNQDTCLDTLSGNGNFIISDGRMPKLGSLEYLLKAGNLVTGGITGVSINGIIDLITPLKTGEFKNITGHWNIDNGVVKDLEVFSNGKDLNMYLSGSYNIENYMANMEVYGTLSSNISSVFGKLKNLSLNTLLNTIPLLNRSELPPEVEAKIQKIPNDGNNSISRIFAVDINGDINGVNYVKSFKWVK